MEQQQGTRDMAVASAPKNSNFLQDCFHLMILCCWTNHSSLRTTGCV